jgi:hypothetical protein
VRAPPPCGAGAGAAARRGGARHGGGGPVDGESAIKTGRYEEKETDGSFGDARVQEDFRVLVVSGVTRRNK